LAEFAPATSTHLPPMPVIGPVPVTASAAEGDSWLPVTATSSVAARVASVRRGFVRGMTFS
jgi:hypothetical protein